MDASEPGLDPGAVPAEGAIAAEVREEFPELRLLWLSAPAVTGRSPRGVRERLRGMSDRFRGSHAVTMRQAPVPWAYRVFYRHIGLDPDADRTPVEAAALTRLIKGAFKSEGILDDALLIALMETGVPIWALDADRAAPPLEIRSSGDGERLGRTDEVLPLPAGRLVVADREGPLAVLFGDLAPGHGVTKRTRRMILFSIQVAGVPTIHVEEALHGCLDVLAAA